MQLLVLIAAGALLAAACSSAVNNQQMNQDSTSVPADQTPIVEQPKEDWVALFDGKTTKGWHNYNKTTIGSAWSIEDGALKLNASKKKDYQTVDGGDILTDKEYENFHLKLEWKISQNGNSGIMFLVQEEPKYEEPWYTGPEFQVLDNNGHSDAKINKHRAGDLYDLITSSPETVKPAGEWNAIELKLDKGKLEYWQNGQQVVTTTMWDDNWNKMVAGSKFSKMPDFGKYRKGRIALQDHGNDVWFRNIMIREL